MKLSTKVSLATLVAGGVYAGVKAYELIKTGKTTVFGFVTIINEDKYNAVEDYIPVTEYTDELNNLSEESVETDKDKSEDIVIDFDEK